MKKLFIILLLSCFFPLLSPVGSRAFPIKLAIIDLGVMNMEKEESMAFTKLIRENFANEKRYNVIPYDKLEEVFGKRDTLSKQKLEQYECTFVPCAVKVARATKADYGVIGRLIKKEEKNDHGIVANIQVIGLVSRRVEYSLNYSFMNEKEFSASAATMVKRLNMWFPEEGETKQAMNKRREVLAKLVEEDYRTFWKKNRDSAVFKHKAGECPPGMALIPAGKFKSGSLKSDSDRYDDEAENEEIYIDEYCIDIYEFPNKKGVKPLVKQEWFGGKDSCEKAGKSLCSEHQWEKACKGPDGTAYTYGNTFDQDKCNSPYIKNGKTMFDRKTKQAGAYGECKNGYGVYDMSGNVYEWTNDSYDGEFYYRVIRGGSWLDHKTKNTRCSTRNTEVPFIHDDTIGFRCCLK